MSKGDWLFRIAAGGIAALALWQGQIALGQQESELVTGKEQSAAHAESNNAAAPVAHQPEEATYRVDYVKACSDPKDREEADLCQQWRSANAAGEAVRMAKNQFWISLVESALLVGTLILSGWAALAASSAARTARKELEELERPHLLVQFDQHGSELVEDVMDVPNSTIIRFHNYGRSPGFMVAVDAQFHFRSPKDGLPEPVSWIRKKVRIYSFGSIVEPSGDSEPFHFRARDNVSREDMRRVGADGVWYFHGFAGYHDTMHGLYTVGFCYTLENGEWRIAAAEKYEDNQHYNYSKRHQRKPAIKRFGFWVARQMRRAADMLNPPAVD